MNTALKTRKPTGLPSWPILLLAGREKAGKSWAAVSASASPLVGRTLYIGIGEDDPDEYSIIPGADFEIVVHDGTYPGILAAVQAAVAEPAGEKPTLIIVDSMTRLWNLIGDNMQAIANRRAKGRKNAAGDFTISMDLWNVAADQWSTVMDALRAHQGPAILTARLDPVAVMEGGQPTTQKEWKIQGHKSLPFDATAIIEMRERGQFLITGVKSARVQLDKPKLFPEFTVDRLWTDLGVADGTADRTHATVQTDRSGAEPGAPREEAPTPAPVASIDWAKEIMPVRDLDDLKAIHQRATQEKELGLTVGADHKQSTLDLIAAWKLPTPQGALTIAALIQAVKAKIAAGELPADAQPVQTDAWPVADIPKDGES
ncbi:hypothetical protein AB0E56_13220 [Microbacterium sp. NPDC028030]|uniref:hypothetical protein n=1 Tax=Microbacterium sp. NPDC028030 TaxID=3155124 RepID=UPI0033EE1985